MSKSSPIKLAPNEELLPDGRILIRGTLRADGTRRPDRIKKAGYFNEEDRQRNKYVTRGTRLREQQVQQQSKSSVQGQYIPGMSGLMRDLYESERNAVNAEAGLNTNTTSSQARAQEKQKLVHHIESLVAHIIDTNTNPSQSTSNAHNSHNSQNFQNTSNTACMHSDASNTSHRPQNNPNAANSSQTSNNRKTLRPNVKPAHFGQDVIVPLVSLYSGPSGSQRLRREIANHFVNNPNDRQWDKLKAQIEQKQLRQAVIRHMSQLLAKKRNQASRREKAQVQQIERKDSNQMNCSMRADGTEISSNKVDTASDGKDSKRTRRRRKKNKNATTGTDANESNQGSQGSQGLQGTEGSNDQSDEKVEMKQNRRQTKQMQKQQKRQENVAAKDEVKIRGRGTFTYGTGKMVSGAFEERGGKRGNKKKKAVTQVVHEKIELDVEGMNAKQRRRKKKQINDKMKQLQQVREKIANGTELETNEIDLLQRADVIEDQLRQFNEFQAKQGNAKNDKISEEVANEIVE